MGAISTPPLSQPTAPNFAISKSTVTTTTTLTDLPLELLSHIFSLSSNPNLCFVNQQLAQSLCPLAKSIYSRIEWLSIRYRNDKTKAVIKGVRWRFFDLELLEALDRIYKQDQAKKLTDLLRKKQRAESRLNRLKGSDYSQLHLYNNKSVSAESTSGLSSAAVSIDTATSSTSGSVAVGLDLDALPWYYQPNRLQHQHRNQSITKRKLSIDQDTPSIPSSSSLYTSTHHQLSSDHPSFRVQSAIDISSASTNSTFTTPNSLTKDQDQLDDRIPLPKNFHLPRRLFKSSQHIDLARELLSRGASVSMPNNYPLVRASQRGDLTMVRMLLSFGAKPDQQALRWSCVEEHHSIVDLYLDMGLIPDEECLRWCVEKKKWAMVEKLIRRGAVPDLQTVLAM